ncbi:MAG: hypothetical protein GY811_24615 [Myxococcales bacterium]|nr:hypothetical protein [Myxococcales bacterium]
MRLGEILVAAKACDEATIEKGLEHSRFSDCRLGTALIELRMVSSDLITAALGKQHGISPAKEANFATVEPEVIALLTGAEAHTRRLFPLGIQRSSGALAVAMCDPQDLGAIDALRAATGKDIIVAAASAHRISQALTEHYGPADSQPIVPEEELLDLELAPSPHRRRSHTHATGCGNSAVPGSRPSPPRSASRQPRATLRHQGLSRYRARHRHRGRRLCRLSRHHQTGLRLDNGQRNPRIRNLRM